MILTVTLRFIIPTASASSPQVSPGAPYCPLAERSHCSSNDAGWVWVAFSSFKAKHEVVLTIHSLSPGLGVVFIFLTSLQGRSTRRVRSQGMMHRCGSLPLRRVDWAAESFSGMRWGTEMSAVGNTFALCLVTDACTFFLQRCLFLEAKRWVWFYKNRTEPSIRKDFFAPRVRMWGYFLLMPFCASLMAEHSGESHLVVY